MSSVPLENDPANGCIGCGPGNPHGLHLQFERVGDSARARFVTQPHHAGWPGRVHTGVLYIALLETMNWAVYANLDRVGFPVRTGALQVKQRVPVGAVLTIVGRLAARSEKSLSAVAEAFDAEGRVVATLDRDYDLPGREEFMRRMGYDEMPAELDGLVP